MWQLEVDNGVFFSHSLSCFLRQSFSLNKELTVSARLAGQEALWDLCVPTPQPQPTPGCRCVQPHSAFTCMIEAQTLPTEPFPLSVCLDTEIGRGWVCGAFTLRRPDIWAVSPHWRGRVTWSKVTGKSVRVDPGQVSLMGLGAGGLSLSLGPAGGLCFLLGQVCPSTVSTGSELTLRSYFVSFVGIFACLL